MSRDYLYQASSYVWIPDYISDTLRCQRINHLALNGETTKNFAPTVNNFHASSDSVSCTLHEHLQDMLSESLCIYVQCATGHVYVGWVRLAVRRIVYSYKWIPCGCKLNNIKLLKDECRVLYLMTLYKKMASKLLSCSLYGFINTSINNFKFY